MKEGKIDGMVLRIGVEGFQKHIHADPVPKTEHIHQRLLLIVDFQWHSLYVMVVNACFVNGITKPVGAYERVGGLGGIPPVRDGYVNRMGNLRRQVMERKCRYEADDRGGIFPGYHEHFRCIGQLVFPESVHASPPSLNNSLLQILLQRSCTHQRWQ